MRAMLSMASSEFCPYTLAGTKQATYQVNPTAMIDAGAIQLCAFRASENQKPNMVQADQVRRSRGVTSQSMFVLFHAPTHQSTVKDSLIATYLQLWEHSPSSFVGKRGFWSWQYPSRRLGLCFQIGSSSCQSLAKKVRHLG